MNEREQHLQEAQDEAQPEVEPDEGRLDQPSQAEGERDEKPDHGPAT